MVYVFFLLMQISVAETQVACDVKTLFEHYKNLMPEDQARIQLSDGSSFINPFFKGEISASDSDLPKRVFSPGEEIPSGPQVVRNPATTKNQAKKLFAEIQNLMITEISGGSSTLTEQQKLMIDRVKNLKFRVTNDCSVLASNVAAAQVVTLCQRALRLPKASLSAIIGHELGHSLDLCHMGCPYHQKTRPGQKLGSLVKGASGDADLQTYFGLADQFPQSTHMVVQTNSAVTEEQIDALIKSGALKKTDVGIPIEQNALTPTYNCLSRKQDYRPLPASQSERCQGTEFTEGGAQIWGARMAGRYMSAHPPQTPLDALGLFAGGELESLFGSKGAGNKIKDFNRIFLSDPSVQKALGCKPDAKQDCLNQFNPSGIPVKAEGSPSSGTSTDQ